MTSLFETLHAFFAWSEDVHMVGHNPQISFFSLCNLTPFDLVIFGGFVIGCGHKFSELACCFIKFHGYG